MAVYSTFINAETQDYVLKDGIFEQQNELATEAYCRIVVPLGSYVFDPSFGSLIPLWINSRNRVTAQIIINEINRALKPMISQKRAKSIGITVNSILLNGFSVTINITDTDGNIWVLPINYFQKTNLERNQIWQLAGGR